MQQIYYLMHLIHNSFMKHVVIGVRKESTRKFTLIGFLKCQWHCQCPDRVFGKTQWGYEISDFFLNLSGIAVTLVKSLELPQKSVGFTFDGAVTGGRICRDSDYKVV